MEETTHSSLTSSGEKWWIIQGYPDFDAGSDGFPHPGQVVAHFRKSTLKANREPWTQRDLATALGITEGSIINMENRNTGLDSYSRRRFLSDLLNIPPILLGLAELPNLTHSSDVEEDTRPSDHSGRQERGQESQSVHQSRTLDLSQSDNQLSEFWQTNHTSSASQQIGQMTQVVSSLYEFLPFSGQEKPQAMNLLIRYHILAGNVLRDQKQFDNALSHLNRAIALAKSIEDDELRVDALFRRGGVYAETKEQNKALASYRKAESLLSHVPRSLAPGLLIELGSIELKVARSDRERTQALQKIDQAGKLIQKTSQEEFELNGHHFKIDMGRFHIDKASALLNIGWYKSAETELGLAEFRPDLKRRMAYSQILMAQAYLGQENFLMAISYLESALDLVLEVKSTVNYRRIVNLVADLRASPYGNDPEIACLVRRLQVRF